MLPDDALEPLRGMLQALDGLNIAGCAFDHDDRTLAWNRNFLRFFPEHAGHVHAGEHYRDNLLRFYGTRLQGADRETIDARIADALARNRERTQPFSFDHRGRRLVVSAQPLGALGRLRVWRCDDEPTAAEYIRRAGSAPAAPHTPLDTLDLVADGVMIADDALRVVWVNEPFMALYGLHDRHGVTGVCFEDVYRGAWHEVPEAQREGMAEGLRTLALQQEYSGLPFELPLPGDGCCRVVEQRAPGGRRIFLHADISALKQQQRALADAERRARDSEALLARKSALLEATIERMEQGVVMINAGHVVEVCNRRAMQILDLPESLFASPPRFADIVAFQAARGEFAQSPPELKLGVGHVPCERQVYERRRPDGRVIEVQSVPIDGGGMLRTYTDITERKRAEERIRHVARHDGLTALVTREVFIEHLAGAVDSAERRAEGFAVHFIDLDRFKPINDRHGHAVGDKVLAIAAGRMRKVARDADIVARMGGDEFAILQYGVADAGGALRLAHRLLATLAQPMDVEQRDLHVGASIGIALCGRDAGCADELLRRADAAMYDAKAAGSNGVRVHGVDAGS